MKNEKEQIIEKAIDSIRINIEDNYNALESLYDSNGLNIDQLEEQWGKLLRNNEDAIEQLYNDVANSIPEKALIIKKKHNSEI